MDKDKQHRSEERTDSAPGTDQDGYPAGIPPAGKCDGKCRITGFLIEYCETCGWSDGWLGGGPDY